MALQEYKKIRSSAKTPEPFGGKPAGNKLQFVVQKHAASHLHYDFRLEVKGVLKSWAIPKGPSMDPAIKHLAMLVEDHPFDYKDFEGIIPKGQYGGGTVIIWDQGTYEPLEPAKTKSEQEKIMLKQFYAGSIKIRMHGRKLKGEFALVRTHGRGENGWLIIKHRDQYAGTADITLKDKSVISRKTIEAMAKNEHAREWQSGRSEASAAVKSAAMPGSHWPKVERQKTGERENISLGKYTLEVTDIEREIWKGIPKGKLIQYYHDISRYMLPYLKDRPESLHVKLVNAGAPGLYIKDMEGRQPDFASVFTDKRRHAVKGKRSQIDYLVCNNEATLLWLINLGCVDINPWNSRVNGLDEPDYIVIDLDPTVKDQKHRFLGKLLDTTLAAKEYFDKNKLKAFAKTSGQTGMHFYLPCSGLNYTEARTIAEGICSEIHGLAPEASTLSNSINSRGDKVYIDPSQNDYADTLAAPYSVRPYHIPTVSTPLEWKEINRRLDPALFTMDVMLERIRKKGDLFKGVLDRKVAGTNTNKLKKPG